MRFLILSFLTVALADCKFSKNGTLVDFDDGNGNLRKGKEHIMSPLFNPHIFAYLGPK